MKKRFIGLLILLLCAWVQSAYGAAGDVALINGKAITAVASVAGKANAAILTIGGKACSDGDTLACTTSDDSQIWKPTTQPGTSSDTSLYTAVKITLSSATRITAYKVRNFDNGSDTGSATTVLYSDDGNGATSKPTSAVADTSKNVLMSAVPAASTVVDYDLATPKEVTAGTYWIVNYEVDSANRLSYYATSSGNRVCYSANGSDWTCVDDTTYDMELWGCQ